MPHIDAEVVGRQVGLPIAVDRDGVDVVGVSIGEDSSGADLHHQICGFQHRHLGCQDWRKMKGKQYIIAEQTETRYTFIQITVVQASACTCREVMVVMSLSRPSSSFRLYPSGRLSLSLTFHSLTVLSFAGIKDLHTTGS